MSLKISKDEARFLAEMINDAQGSAWKHARTKEEAREWSRAVGNLERKLKAFGQDRRRLGRTSKDDWRDLMIRIAKTWGPRY